VNLRVGTRLHKFGQKGTVFTGHFGKPKPTLSVSQSTRTF